MARQFRYRRRAKSLLEQHIFLSKVIIDALYAFAVSSQTEFREPISFRQVCGMRSKSPASPSDDGRDNSSGVGAAGSL